MLAPLLVSALAWEGANAAVRFRARTNLFAQARARAHALQRPLIVIGDPDAGAHTRIRRAYPCGDLCVDLNGCPQCPKQLKADITKRLPASTDSAVVFVSCVLEYVDDLPAAWAEIQRVAGSDLNIFVVRVQPLSATAYLFPGAKWVLRSAPPIGPLDARRISNDPRDGSGSGK